MLQEQFLDIPNDEPIQSTARCSTTIVHQNKFYDWHSRGVTLKEILELAKIRELSRDLFE